MIVFKTFFKILKKYKLVIAIYAGIFLIIMVFNSSSDTSVGNTFSGESISFTVINRDGSYIGDAIKEYLSKGNNFKEKKDDIKSLRNDLFYRDIYYVLIVPEGYEKSVEAGKPMELTNMKVKASSMGYYMDIKVDRFISAVNNYIAAGEDLQDAVDDAMNIMDTGAEASMVSGDKIKENPDYYTYYTLGSFVIVSIVIGCLAPILMAFGRKDIRKRINCSSINYKNYNLQLAAGSLITCMAIWVIFNLLSWILYSGEMSVPELVLYMLNTLCFILVAMGMAFITGSLVSNDLIINGITNVLGLGMSFLGGAFVPLSVLGEGIRRAAKFVPVYWYIMGTEEISGVKKWADFDLHAIAVDMGVQILYAAAIFALAMVMIKKFRVKES